MMQRNDEDILFPVEIVPWDEVVRLVINLLVPFRHRAKGIECITGRRAPYQQSPGCPVVWFPFVLDENYLQFIKEHLQELPSLDYPLSLSKANDFIDTFIMLKDSPEMVPSFLTGLDINADQEKRDNLFATEKNELERLMSEGDAFLINTSRRKCKHLSHGAYFTKRGAIQYLERKGLLDRAFSIGSSWRDQIQEPKLGGSPLLTEDIHYGLPQELIKLGIQEYRKTLTLRKSEAVARQLTHLLPTSVEREQIIEDDPGVINASAPLTETASGLLVSEPALAVDIIPSIQASSPFAIGKNKVKSSSPQYPAVSKYNETKSVKENPVTECKTTLLNESDPSAIKLIGMKDVMDRLGVSRPTIYNYLNQESPSYNPNFPKPVKLNEENKWIEAEIDAFLKALTPLKKKR